MNARLALVIVGLGLAVGLVFGFVLAGAFLRPELTVKANTVDLQPAEQDDFIIMVAEAYAGDHDLSLAKDRLTRLHESNLALRVEKLAASYAPQRDLVATYLSELAAALGAKNVGVVALAVANTDTPLATAADLPVTTTPNPNSKIAAVAVDKRATPQVAQKSPTLLPTRARSVTPKPPATSTSRPPTLLPTATDNPPPAPPSATPVPPTPRPQPAAPGTAFYPDRSRWPASVYFNPANVAAGQGYWHLKKAIYCDAYDNSDPRQHDFGCDELPGGSAGTNIYVMTGGQNIDVIAPDGRNVGSDPSVIGDKKSPGDMCNCTYSFESGPFKISVAGAPSDAIGGFCLCSVNFGWGSRAHVRYFLYFEYVTR